VNKVNTVTDVNYILENGIKILKGLPLIEISRLKRHPNNIKKHPEEQIKNLMELMKIVGFKDPIVIDKKEEIKAGHGRLDAAEKLGMKRVPYVPLEGLTKKQMDLFMYMDNYVNESPWIDDNVQLLLENISLPDLNSFEVNWDDIITLEPKEETEIPEPPDSPKSKLGDIYQLGIHRVMCGDATNKESISTLLVDCKPELLYTDPPYGLGGYAGRSGKFNKMKGDDDDPKQYYLSLPKTIPERYIWGSWSNLKDFDESPRDVIIWKKNNFGMGRGYRNQYELCMYFGTFAESDSDVWEVKKDIVSEYKHPTQKPVELATRAIINSSKQGDSVLDLYMGSGSTLIACEQTNRICYGMELDCSYIDVILDRWSNYTGKEPIRVSDGKSWSEIKSS